ncbi:hypothetical protein Ancab_021442 [Ancistrocladus abbreviatus]
MMMMKRLSFNGGGGGMRSRRMNETDSVAVTTTSSDIRSATAASTRRDCVIDPEEEEMEWELRPGGMLVQKRRENGMDNTSAIPVIRVRVAFGATRFQISVNSQATFGELKKLLTAECGLQHWEQRLLFRGREKENKEFLDICGVKDGSKLVLIEDPCSREKRLMEMRRNNQIQRALRAVSDISSDVDVLTEQVSAIEKSISDGVKVAEVRITTLFDMLMRKAVKLDSIPTEGEASALKNLQAIASFHVLQSKRVQKCVETLDMLKISNANIKPAVIVTTKWETFDPHPAMTSRNLLD